MQPLVSVVLTTYNGASRGFLAQAVDSVLNQTFHDYELIIIDDGSRDETKAQCKRHLLDPRVRYIYQENRGLAGARNAGIRASSSPFICFLDDDDRWQPTKLERQLEFVHGELRNFTRWGLIFTWIELIDGDGRRIGYRGHHQKGSIYRKLLFGNTIDAPSSVLVKREVFTQVGLFDESLRKCQDWDMWLRIARNYHIFPLKEYLVQYREHKNSISANHAEVFVYEQAVLKKALTTAPSDISSREVLASCYLNRSVGFFASDNYRQFRKMWLAGARLSLKSVRFQHALLLPLSFLGKRTVNHLREVKRFFHKMIIDWTYQRISQEGG
jgi:glycosyltransferase involved in cell wall biosynthesis